MLNKKKSLENIFFYFIRFNSIFCDGCDYRLGL